MPTSINLAIHAVQQHSWPLQRWLNYVLQSIRVSPTSHLICLVYVSVDLYGFPYLVTNFSLTSDFCSCICCIPTRIRTVQVQCSLKHDALSIGKIIKKTVRVNKRHFYFKKTFFFTNFRDCKNTAFLQKYILVKNAAFLKKIYSWKKSCFVM